VDVDNASILLWTDIKNLVISHHLYPVDAYEFPQEKVAEFWKSVFLEKGIKVYGSEEIPDGVNVLQASFNLPDDPPEWLVAEEE